MRGAENINIFGINHYAKLFGDDNFSGSSVAPVVGGSFIKDLGPIRTP
jgi:hypothetical protein